MNWTETRWNFYASHYDRFISFASQRRRSIQLAALHPGERVLVAGCGTGLDLPHLPPGIEIHAVDISPAMIARARHRAAALGLDAHIEVMDVTRLEYPDEHFDAILLHLIVAVVPDSLAVLREAARVLKPRGRITLFDKYFSGEGKPRLLRRVLNPLVKLAATDLNVRLADLAALAGLEFVHEEPAWLNGMFRIVRLEKVTGTRTGSSSSAA